MATYADLRDRSLRMINNPNGEGIDPTLILDGICAAHDAIMPWRPKLAQTSLTGDGILGSFPLPEDFYSVEAVIFSETGEILPQAVFSPRSYYGSQVEATNEWILSPTGSLSFAKIPDSGDIYTLYYCATWNKPTTYTQETHLLEPPGYLDMAMALYTASYLLLPDLVGTAGIGPYKTRVDSGTPEDNPLQKAVTFLMNLFTQEMNRHPKHQRAQT